MEQLKEKLNELRDKRNAINDEIKQLEDSCEHEFANGYTLEPIIYCAICDREATDIFPNMSYKHIEKLVEK